MSHTLIRELDGRRERWMWEVIDDDTDAVIEAGIEDTKAEAVAKVETIRLQHERATFGGI